MTKNTNATDKKLADLRAKVAALEAGEYRTGIMQELDALYDEITAISGRA